MPAVSPPIKHVALLGATGYTGIEMARLLDAHPFFHIDALSSQQHANRPLHSLWHGAPDTLPTLQTYEALQDAIEQGRYDVVFACLPHQTSHHILKSVSHKSLIIDLSADFRLNSAVLYETWYKNKHSAPAMLSDFVYGLTEIYRPQIQKTRLLANPGCYPTAALLPLLPLLLEGLVEPSPIIIDAKSGASGAGRQASTAFSFCEVSEDIRPYALEGHRHSAEIKEHIERASASTPKGHHKETPLHILFTPQVVACRRGILATIYCHAKRDITPQHITHALAQYFHDEPFVHVTTQQRIPSMREARHSNRCVIGVSPKSDGPWITLVSVIDNLLKGACGQALQNANLMCGYDETCGLPMTPPAL
ncbi:MAG: N-acetyl-gamma-glutamyl-phosphate reductase [Alphaproteobacteria bacterium GM7ARS4]|nr:N-acetyl-gamma-glutamyl-phosphate reductase [Alphaproteobacteria bacterium GM7ARS4]